MADEWIERLVRAADNAVANGVPKVEVDPETVKRLANLARTDRSSVESPPSAPPECDQCADVRGTLDKLDVGPGNSLAERVGLLAARTGPRPEAVRRGVNPDDRAKPRL